MCDCDMISGEFQVCRPNQQIITHNEPQAYKLQCHARVEHVVYTVLSIPPKDIRKMDEITEGILRKHTFQW